MVGLAMSGPPPSLMPDFGALFGSGGLDMSSLWAPPHNAPSPAPTSPPPAPVSHLNQPEALSHQHSLLPHFSTEGPGRSVREYKSLLAACDSLSSLKTAHATLHSQDDIPLNFSVAARQCLFRCATHHEILLFLQSDLDHPAASNTRDYLNHLFAANAHPDLIKDCLDIACDKITLATLPLLELTDLLIDLTEASKSGLDACILLDACRRLQLSITSAYPPKSVPLVLAQNLLSALSSLPPSSDVFEQLCPLLDLVPLRALRTTIRSLSDYFGTLIETQTCQSESSSQLSACLSLIPSKRFNSVVCLATEHFVTFLAELETSEETVARSETVRRLLCWLTELRTFDPSILQPLSKCADRIYPLVASHYAISDLGPYIQSLHPADAADIMLHYWIKPIIMQQPSKSEPKALKSDPASPTSCVPVQPLPRISSRRAAAPEAPFQKYGLTYTMSRSHNQLLLHGKSFKTRQNAFHKIASTLRERSRPTDEQKHPTKGGAFVHLFRLLSQHKIEYAFWLDELFQVLKSHKSPLWTYSFFARLGVHNVHIPFPVAQKVIQFFISIGKPGWAFQVFDRPGAQQWLSNVPELLFALIDHYPVKSEFVFKLINRREYTNSLPVNLRSNIKNPLSLEQTSMVNHVAYALAKSPHLSSTMAFRRVCDCLNFLRDRDAPLSSMMSRALVLAGVTRPLREGVWLSTMKVQWILKFVRELEGEEIASRLDEAAFALRHENFELNQQQMQSFEELEEEADDMAWEYRKQFGHRSQRWSKRPSRRLKMARSSEKSRDDVRFSPVAVNM